MSALQLWDADEAWLCGAFDAAPPAATVRHPDRVLAQTTAADPGLVKPPERLPGSDRSDQ